MLHSKITIVIPVYNVEKYLDRCLISIVNQTYKNLEIILVDDESPDGCPQMCDNWSKKDGRIKVIHKKNEGLGMARNTGIEHATGDFVCFVDSDDCIELETIEKALKTANKEQADAVYYGHKDIDINGKVIRDYTPELEKLVYRESEVETEILPELISPNYSNRKQANLMLSACTALFSMKIIREANWRFVSEREIISEDVYSLMNLFVHIHCLAIVPESLYSYCQNSTSLTRTYRADRYQGIKNFYDRTIQLCDAYGHSRDIKSRLASAYLAFVIASLKLIILSDESVGVKFKNIKEILRDSHLKDTLQKVDLRVESKSRKLICNFLIKERAILCYVALYIRYKLKE